MSSKKIHAPTYTQIPNIVLDEWMKILSHIELKVMLFICRKTFGWHKERVTISLKEIHEELEGSKNWIIKAIKSLVKHGLIKETQNKIHNCNLKTTYEVIVIYPDESPKIAESQALGGTDPVLPPSTDPVLPPSTDTVPPIYNIYDINKEANICKKDIYIGPSSKNSKKKPAKASPSAEASGITNYFLQKLKEKVPDLKQPNLEKWAQTFDLMIRVDKRNIDEMKQVMDFVRNSSSHRFIMSPDSFRKHYDQQRQFMETKNIEDIINVNRRIAFNTKRERPGDFKDVEIKKDYMINNKTGKDVSFSLPKPQFIEAAKHLLGI